MVFSSLVQAEARSDAGPEPTHSGHRRRRRRHGAESQGHPLASQVYGYHNIFHTHAAPSTDTKPPPGYDLAAICSKRLPKPHTSRSTPQQSNEPLPGYSCDVAKEGVLALKTELVTPFRHASNRKWQDVQVVLRGTQLLIYRTKSCKVVSRQPGEEKTKRRVLIPGKLLKTYTLQHAEVGVALDFKRTELVPRSTVAKLVLPKDREKLYEVEPHLFEPVREHVLRLRLETEQMLFCCDTQDALLDWVEILCTAIDISQPIEDRSEPRYRSLPRRNRRQRLLESMGSDEQGEISPDQRLVEEQERIFRSLYPHLAAQDPDTGNEGGTEATLPESPDEATLRDATADPDADDLDRADVLDPSQSPHRRASSFPNSPPSTPLRSASGPQDAVPFNPKTAPLHETHPATLLRYRKRCAPILLYHSPRASDITISNGARVRIDPRTAQLLPFTELPPRYDAHQFPETPTISIPSSLELEHSATNGSATTADSETSESAESNESSERTSSVATTSTAATTPTLLSPPPLFRGRSDDSLVFTPEENEHTMNRQLQHSASETDLNASSSWWKISKRKGKAKQQPQQQPHQPKENERPTTQQNGTTVFGRKFTEEESREVTRSLGSMGLLM